MKNKIIVIYYIIAIIFIISGFILGTNTKTYNEGYTVYDYTYKEKNYYSGGYTYPSKEIGDKHIEKSFGWFDFYYEKDKTYYEGNIKIPNKTLKKATSSKQLYAAGNPDSDFHQVKTENIIISIVIIIIILIIPIIISLIVKLFKKNDKDKILKEIRKLKEQLDLDIISEEEYEYEKNKILKKYR